MGIEKKSGTRPGRGANNNFIVSGDDSYLVSREEKRVCGRFLSDEETGLNFSVYGQERITEALSFLGTIPFLSKNRVAVIRDLGSMDESSENALLEYLDKPSKTGVLIITCDAEFRKRSLYRKIAAKVSEIKIDKMSPLKVKDGIKKFFDKEKVRITDAAIELLMDLKGSDPASLRSELEKLVSFSEEDEIGVEDVEMLVGRDVRETVFGLAEAIFAGDMRRVFVILNDLDAQKKSAQEIVGYLAWYIRTIQDIKFMSSRGLGMNEIASSAGKAVYRMSQTAKRYSVKKTIMWMKNILDTDIDIKRSRKEPFLALEMLVVKLERA